MANNSVTFKINLNIDGKDRVVTATTAVENLKHVVYGVNEAAEDLRNQLINTNQMVEAWNNVTGAFQQVLGVINQVTAESRSFGAAMAATNTMAGKSGEEFAAMKQQVADLAKEIPVARDELANGLYQVISNGVPEDNWIDYLRSSAQASVGGIADLGEVVKVTSTIIKNYGLEWSNAAEIQDKIQLTAKNGVTSFEQMAQALPRVTAQASTLGVTVDELMASFATLTGVSGNTAEVSTQLAAIFTALIKPSSEATEMAQQMGIQFDAAAIKAAGGMQQFLSSLSKDVKQFAATSGMLEQEIYGKLFGSAESLRAITPLVGNLANKFQENAAQMQNSAGTVSEAFGIMGNTGSAQLQMLNNKLGEYTDMIQGSIGNVLPYANMASQLIVTMNSAYSLANSLKALEVTSKVSSAAVAMFSPICKVVSAAFTGAAVSAETLRLAIRSLMIATGVGIAITALTEIINYLSSSSDKAAGSVDRLSEAKQRAKAAHEQTAQQIASVRSEMDLNIAKLKDFKGSKEQEKTLVQQMNTKYGEVLGYYSSVSQWYQALTANSETYCNQMINEIRLRKLANQAAHLQQQQHDIKYNADGTLKKYGTKNKPGTKATGQVDAGDGKIIPIKQEVEVKGASQLANANKQLTSLYRQEQNVRKEMKKIVVTNNHLKIIKTDGWRASAPNLGTTVKTKTKTAPKPIPTTTDKKDDPLEGSIAWYNKAIEDKKKELEATAVATTRKQLQNEIEGLERELGMMKVKAGIEITPDIEVRKTSKGLFQKLDEDIADWVRSFKPIEIDVKVKGEAFDKVMGDIKDGWGSIQGVGNGIQGITDALQGNENAWQALSGIINGFISVAEGIKGVVSLFDMLTASTNATTTATTASTTATTANTAASIANTTVKSGEAIAGATASGAKLPFPANIAAIAAGVAAVVAALGMISGAFANGGVVGGNSPSGDKLLARVNSGEMILNAAQQARLFALANGTAVSGITSQLAMNVSPGVALPSVSVQTSRLQNLIEDGADNRKLDINLKLRGRDLVAAIANETRTNSRRSNIR